MGDFLDGLRGRLDEVTVSNAKNIDAKFSSLAHVLRSAVPLADSHFHQALESHSRIIAGVIDRPVYGFDVASMGEWRGESDYYNQKCDDQEGVDRSDTFESERGGASPMYFHTNDVEINNYD